MLKSSEKISLKNKDEGKLKRKTVLKAEIPAYLSFV